MNCNWQSNRLSVLPLLPWLAFLAILEQGPAIQFYPDTNFAQEVELVAFTTFTDTVLPVKDLSAPKCSAITSVEYPLVIPNISDQSPSFSPFIHLHAKALVVSWIQARSQAYRHS